MVFNEEIAISVSEKLGKFFDECDNNKYTDERINEELDKVVYSMLSREEMKWAYLIGFTDSYKRLNDDFYNCGAFVAFRSDNHKMREDLAYAFNCELDEVWDESMLKPLYYAGPEFGKVHFDKIKVAIGNVCFPFPNLVAVFKGVFNNGNLSIDDKNYKSFSNVQCVTGDISISNVNDTVCLDSLEFVGGNIGDSFGKNNLDNRIPNLKYLGGTNYAYVELIQKFEPEKYEEYLATRPKELSYEEYLANEMRERLEQVKEDIERHKAQKEEEQRKGR